MAGGLRCVLVHAGSGGPPPRLERAFAAKKISAEMAEDVFRALARICLLAQDDAVVLPILAIIEPERIENAVELFEAAAVYAPKAVLWVYSTEPNEQIREVRESDLAAWRAARGKGLGEQTASKTRTDDSGAPAPHAETGTKSGEQVRESTAESGVILTDEELEMLLADDIIDDLAEEPNDSAHDHDSPANGS